MAYELPPLPYEYDALEPTIDEQTMRIHHDKHHQAYVDNLNKAVEGTEFANRSLEQLLGALEETASDDKQNAIRNNGGGHANHSLFWDVMAPGGAGEPSGALADAINDLLGGTDQLKAAMNDNGVKRFGSGWSWLVWDGTGLELYSTPNQDSPWMRGHVPVLGIDVWEHAYYLKYQNRRPDYLAAWWDVVNWDVVGGRFDEARSRSETTSWDY
jgi:Fe-Mn family superoxide dismutase